MYKDKYTFEATLTFANDGISIEFIDLREAISCADSEHEALINAEEVLGL